SERIAVVQHTPGDDGVEGTWVVELLQRGAKVRRARGGVGIDGEDVVPAGDERTGDSSLPATADLQHPQRRRRKLPAEVGGEIHGARTYFRCESLAQPDTRPRRPP